MNGTSESVFFLKQKTAYVSHIRYWSSDVCSSDLAAKIAVGTGEDHDFGRGRVHYRAKRVAQLRIAGEGQRILALGPIEGDRGDAGLESPAEMLRGEVVGRHWSSAIESLSLPSKQ